MTDERHTQYLNPREVAGRFLLSKGHVMGDKIDAGIVQDYLEEVLDTVARLREERRWIPVEERNPEFSKTWQDGVNTYQQSDRVLILDRRWGQCTGVLYGSGWADSVGNRLYNVTHWKPLDDPPVAEAALSATEENRNG